MKNNILLLALISLALFSCKKDKKTAPDNNGKIYTVDFGVSIFSQSSEPIGDKTGKKTLADTSNIKQINKLSYILYKTDGTKIKTRNYLNTQLDFGSIRDSLPQGNYTAVFLGGDYAINNNNGELDNGTGSILFYKKINFTVSDNPVSQSITLDRMNAGLQVIITDTPPANDYARSYQVIVTDYSTFSIYNYQPLNTTPVNRYRLVESNGLGTPIDLGTIPTIVNTLMPATVTIGAYRNSNGSSVIAFKTVGNVMFYRNKKTILSGKLFSNGNTGTGNTGFSVTFNDAALNTDTTKYGF